MNVGTRGNAVLDKIWTNMDKLYMSPITLSDLGKSDHNMVLLNQVAVCHVVLAQ